jgi:CHAD domain-containing protein
MTQHPLAAMLAGHNTEIHQLANTLKTGIDAEVIHALRVETKRMRAILRLLRFFQPHWPYGRHYDAFRTLFHAAGALRELQLQLGMLEAAPDKDLAFYEIYRVHLMGQMVEARRHLQDILKKKLPAGDDLVEAADMQFKYCRKSDFALYFNAKAEEIHRYKTGNPYLDPANIHPLRKAIKDYNNNRRNTKTALKFDPGPVPDFSHADSDMEKMLGDWNDFDTALIHLAQAEKQKWARPHHDAILELRRYWTDCADALWYALDEQPR